MKTLMLLLLLPTSLFGQNTFSVVYHPTDMGIGLRYDRQIENYGVFSYISKGDYHINEYMEIDNHFKIVIGGLHYLKNVYNGHTKTYVSLGLSYHYYSDIYEGLVKTVYYPISFEAGAGAKFKKTMIGFFFDFVKQEGGINIGINFN